MKKSFIATSLVGLLVGVGTGQANASGYTFTDLRSLGGGYSQAFSINNAGQVTGNSTTFDNLEHATKWNGATPTDLGTLAHSTHSISYGINDSGQIAGGSWTSGDVIKPWQGPRQLDMRIFGDSRYIGGDKVQNSTLWNGTTPTNLGTLGGSDSIARGINNSGQVAGYSYTSGNTAAHATIWNGTTPTDLGTLGGTLSAAYSINNSGQVAGYSDTLGDIFYHATIWNGATPTDLGTLGLRGGYSEAFGINDAGQVVGVSNIDGTSYTFHATIWNGTTPTDLGLGAAYGINDSGQVVGSSTHGATIWNGSTPTDLNDFLDASAISAGWYLERASAINDNGWIVGTAGNIITGEWHAFLLTPCDTCPIYIPPPPIDTGPINTGQVPDPIPVATVPEPETYAMFMAGLGLMGFIARRRKNGHV
jgi:probable HAF family extracellular repeat protein